MCIAGLSGQSATRRVCGADKLPVCNDGKWSQGDFHADWVTEPAPVPLDELALGQQPGALTRAVLEGWIGAPFFPGIEVTY
jgi:hypothetical protein